MRDLFNGREIVLRDYRHPGLDSMDTHLVEFPCDCYFLSPAQHDPRGLLAVSQGNVVKDNLFLELESRNNVGIEVEAAGPMVPPNPLPAFRVLALHLSLYGTRFSHRNVDCSVPVN